MDPAGGRAGTQSRLHLSPGGCIKCHQFTARSEGARARHFHRGRRAPRGVPRRGSPLPAPRGRSQGRGGPGAGRARPGGGRAPGRWTRPSPRRNRGGRLPPPPCPFPPPAASPAVALSPRHPAPCDNWEAAMPAKGLPGRPPRGRSPGWGSPRGGADPLGRGEAPGAPALPPVPAGPRRVAAPACRPGPRPAARPGPRRLPWARRGSGAAGSGRLGLQPRPVALSPSLRLPEPPRPRPAGRGRSGGQTWTGTRARKGGRWRWWRR